MESADELKQRIDDAARYVPLERLALSTQCGFGSNAEGNQISYDAERAKLELVVEVARDVWIGLSATRPVPHAAASSRSR